MRLRAKKPKLLLKPTEHGFENEGVFNPAVIRVGDKVHMFYRAVRKGNFSSIGYCRLNGPLEVEHRSLKPILFPEDMYESQGMEDPRITKIDDTYYLTYSAYDRRNVLGALATSTDLENFEKKGIITPQLTYREYKQFMECNKDVNEKYYYHYKIFKEHGLGSELAEKLLVWDKNLMFFPKKINGKFALIHRIHPGIQLVLFDDFSDLTDKFWKDYFINFTDHIIMDPVMDYESHHIGGGCPPIETEQGWLFIYHAVEDKPEGLVYHASAALLDKNNPLKVLGRLEYPLISPELPWEQKGIVNNVIFPTGTAVFDEILYIYYGAADHVIGVAKVPLKDLLNKLLI